MIQTLPELTSTIIFKLPCHLYVPPFEEKIRARKTIVRRITQILQNRELVLLYAGYKHENKNCVEMQQSSADTTIISIHILAPDARISNFNIPVQILLKRFKREVQYNNEHILIDSTEIKNNHLQRNIEIYIKNRRSFKQAVRQEYSFSIAPNYQLSY
ncbi:MAG TPA: hypothetical protein VK623_08500 [Flavobacterium sp.]|nr:hypothetical protein [Flavobacterium sp.]